MRSSHSGKKGFTLIETVLALAVTVVILGIVLAALRLGIRSWERGEAALDGASVRRALASRLAGEIGSMYPYMTDGGKAKEFAFNGSRDGLGFVTVKRTALAGPPWGGAMWVYYSAGPEGLTVGEKTLTSDALRDSSGAKSFVIEPLVTGIRFEYMGDGEWQESWNADDKKGLPRAVRASVTLKDAQAPFTFTVPVGVALTARQESGG